MHDNSEKKASRVQTMQRHLSHGAISSEVLDTSRDDMGAHDVPDIVEEKPNEIELAEMKQQTPKMDMASVEAPLVAQTEKDDNMAELVKIIETKVESFDPEKKELKDGEFDTEQKKVGYCGLLMRYANCTDKIFLIVAYSAATIWGACMPALVLFFGEMIDSIATIETASESLSY